MLEDGEGLTSQDANEQLTKARDQRAYCGVKQGKEILTKPEVVGRYHVEN